MVTAYHTMYFARIPTTYVKVILSPYITSKAIMCQDIWELKSNLNQVRVFTYVLQEINNKELTADVTIDLRFQRTLSTSDANDSSTTFQIFPLAPRTGSMPNRWTQRTLVLCLLSSYSHETAI